MENSAAKGVTSAILHQVNWFHAWELNHVFTLLKEWLSKSIHCILWHQKGVWSVSQLFPFCVKFLQMCQSGLRLMASLFCKKDLVWPIQFCCFAFCQWFWWLQSCFLASGANTLTSMWHGPICTTCRHCDHPAKVSSLQPNFAIDQPPSNTMQQHQEHILWLKSMLHVASLSDGKMILIWFSMANACVQNDWFKSLNSGFVTKNVALSRELQLKLIDMGQLGQHKSSSSSEFVAHCFNSFHGTIHTNICVFLSMCSNLVSNHQNCELSTDALHSVAMHLWWCCCIRQDTAIYWSWQKAPNCEQQQCTKLQFTLHQLVTLFVKQIGLFKFALTRWQQTHSKIQCKIQMFSQCLLLSSQLLSARHDQSLTVAETKVQPHHFVVAAQGVHSHSLFWKQKQNPTDQKECSNQLSGKSLVGSQSILLVSTSDILDFLHCKLLNCVCVLLQTGCDVQFKLKCSAQVSSNQDIQSHIVDARASSRQSIFFCLQWRWQHLVFGVTSCLVAFACDGQRQIRSETWQCTFETSEVKSLMVFDADVISSFWIQFTSINVWTCVRIKTNLGFCHYACVVRSRYLAFGQYSVYMKSVYLYPYIQPWTIAT